MRIYKHGFYEYYGQKVYVTVDTSCDELRSNHFYYTEDGFILTESIPLKAAMRVEYSGDASAINVPVGLMDQFISKRRKTIAAPKCKLSEMIRRDDILTLCFGEGMSINVKVREKRRYESFDRLYEVYGEEMLCSDRDSVFKTDIEGIFGGGSDEYIAFEIGYEWSEFN